MWPAIACHHSHPNLFEDSLFPSLIPSLLPSLGQVRDHAVWPLLPLSVTLIAFTQPREMGMRPSSSLQLPISPHLLHLPQRHAWRRIGPAALRSLLAVAPSRRPCQRAPSSPPARAPASASTGHAAFAGRVSHHCVLQVRAWIVRSA